MKKLSSILGSLGKVGLAVGLTTLLGCNTIKGNLKSQKVKLQEKFPKKEILAVGEFTGDTYQDKFVKIGNQVYFARGLGNGKYELKPIPGKVIREDRDGDGLKDIVIVNDDSQNNHYPDELVFGTKDGFYKVIKVY